MVDVAYDPLFEKKVRKIKDTLLKEKVKKQIIKIINLPEAGKPMRFCHMTQTDAFKLKEQFIKRI